MQGNFSEERREQNLRSGESSPQLQLVGVKPARGLEGADSPVAAVTKYDRVGVGFDPNSPDRSWCGTSSRHTRSGDTDRQTDTLTLKKTGKGKLLKRRREGNLKSRAVSRAEQARSAGARDCAALRCAPRGEHPKKIWRKSDDPLDNPHRRCSAWLGRCVLEIMNVKTPAAVPTVGP